MLLCLLISIHIRRFPWAAEHKLMSIPYQSQLLFFLSCRLKIVLCQRTSPDHLTFLLARHNCLCPHCKGLTYRHKLPVFIAFTVRIFPASYQNLSFFHPIPSLYQCSAAKYQQLCHSAVPPCYDAARCFLKLLVRQPFFHRNGKCCPIRF